MGNHVNRRSVLNAANLAIGAAGLFGAIGSTAASKAAPERGGRAASVDRLEVPGGVSLFYRDWGIGRPMIFLAPWGLHSGWWEYQMANLSQQGVRCVAYDRRGHGRSSEPRDGYDFDALSDDLSALIAQLGVRDITLVGQSLGCGEIVRYLSRHQAHHIRRVILIAPITPFLLKTENNPDGTDAAALEKVRRYLSTDRAQAIAGAAPSFFNSPKNPVSAEMMAWWTNMLMQCPLRVLLELHKMFTTTDFRAELPTISVATTVIQGDNDTSTPIEQTGRKTVALIPGSRLVVYEGAGHALPITHMDRLNRDLLSLSE